MRRLTRASSHAAEPWPPPPSPGSRRASRGPGVRPAGSAPGGLTTDGTTGQSGEDLLGDDQVRAALRGLRVRGQTVGDELMEGEQLVLERLLLRPPVLGAGLAVICGQIGRASCRERV